VALSEFQTVIGIECHVQLDTKTKLFCACPVAYGQEPNTAICSVCTGQPGALPAINGQAVALGIRAGLALGCQVNKHSVFARKNYFYPDLPKGYQISQFDKPLCTGGTVHARLNAETKAFALTRIHLEEDAGKLLHDGPDSRVDWNRAGTPLAEIVSDPVMHSAEEAVAYMRMLHRCMVAAKICKGDMEKGHMRFDVNISVHKPHEPLGTRVEIKNLNSFRFAAKAIEGEIARQIGILEAGGAIRQHTRGWTGSDTAPMREKEAASDYRYFPDPDLPPLRLEEAELIAQSNILTAAPLDLHLLAEDEAENERWARDYGLDPTRIALLRSDARTAAFFEACVASGGKPQDMAAWVQTELLRCLKASENGWALVALQARHIVELQALIDNGELSHTAAKKVFEVLFREGGEARSHVERMGLLQVTDADTLRAAVSRVLEAHPSECLSFREGNQKVMGFLMGKIMREMAGAADPQLVRSLLADALEGP
jgi:aspartyl-tRNA(Asn)/glutamyl-tRNA(Gln) amidotransferase subunit B